MVAKVNCMGCGASVTVSTSLGNIREVHEQSGYESIILIDTSMRWLCPACLSQAIPHIQALVDLLKNKDVFWNSLPHLLNQT